MHRILLPILIAPSIFAAEETHWGYHGDGSPMNWADLDEAYTT